MIIIAIGWLYVVVMIAAVSDSLLIGIVRLIFLGVLPVGLLLWIKLRGYRARAEAASEQNSES
jgi:type VI protein secretion system component VasK